MTSPWTVSAGTDRVQLDATGRAEATFTVTNQGPTDQRMVFDVVPGETVDRAWFTVVEPQLLVSHGGSTTFLVRLTVPAGTPAGSRWFAGRAYSADRAPEETSVVSDRVAFDVRPSVAPVPWWRKWWWLLALAALTLVALVVVLVLVLGGDDEPTGPPQPGTEFLRGSLVLGQTAAADLDQVNFEGDESQADIWFEAETETERYLTPQNGAMIAYIGSTANAATACAGTSMTEDRLPVDRLTGGDVVCVRTNEGRLAVMNVFEPATPSPGQLRLSITTYQS